MNHRVRILLLLIIPAFVFSCREVSPLESNIVIAGYQLSGTITTSNGIPINSVWVSLCYSYVPIRYIPLDTVQVIVADSTKIVSVFVYNSNFQYVRKLFLGTRRPGLLPRFLWNERDDSGGYIPSGKYYIKYQYDTAVVKVVPYLAEGHYTTMTNSAGEFMLSSNQLPVGELFDFYNTIDSTYIATYEVLPEVELVFTKGSHVSIPSSVALQHNKITRGVFKLE